MESSKMYTNYSQLNMLGMGSGMNYQNFLGSGFGMGGFGMNSLFGTGFGGCNMFQNCDGTYNYDAMAGVAVGGVLTNCLFGFLGQVVSNRQAKKAEAPEAKLETLKTQQADLTKEVAVKTTDFNEANKAYETAKGKYEANKKVIDDYTGSVKLNNETIIEKYEAWYKSDAATRGDAPYTEAQYNEAIAAKKAYEEAVKNEASLKSAMDSAETKMNAAKKAKEEKESELQSVKDEIEKIETENKANTTEKVLDKADGHKYQQTKLTELNALFKVDSEGKESFYSGNVKSSHKDLRGAIAQYRLAKSDNEKQKWANRISILWNNLSDEDQKNNKDLIAGIDAMRKNYKDLTFNNI